MEIKLNLFIHRCSELNFLWVYLLNTYARNIKHIPLKSINNNTERI